MDCEKCHNERVIDRDVYVSGKGYVATLIPCPVCAQCELCDEPIVHDDTTRAILHDPQEDAMLHADCWERYCVAEELCVRCGDALYACACEPPK